VKVGICNMKIELAKQPKKYMTTCNKKEYDKINDALIKLENPHELQGKIKKLQGRKDEYRIALPPYRILFKLDKVNKMIIITKIDVRGDVYKKG
jgi:mRNA-degrading endonuclease RelE of RelBE toxin-antitoxin system